MLILEQGGTMNNSTAVNKRLFLLFWLVMIVCLLPFVLLSFLNDMAADDFHYYNLYRSHGFWGVQGYVYHTWAGRYTTNFLNSSFVGLDVLHRYYWVPCLSLMAGTWGACLFLVRTVYAVVRTGSEIPGILRLVAPASVVLCVLLLYVQADIATGFYWFSSAIVYQPSMILSLVLMGLLIRRFCLAGSGSVSLDVLILLMMALLCGCNEMAAVFLLVSLGVGLVAFWRGFSRSALGLYFGVVLAICILIALTSGVLWVRHKEMNGSNSVLGIVSAVLYQLVVVLFSVFKEPLAWFAGIAVFLFGVRLSGKDIPMIAVLKSKKIFSVGPILLLAVVFLSLMFVMIGSRGSLPPRAINNLSGWVVVGLLVFCFAGGIYRRAQGSGEQGLGLPLVSPVVLATMLLLALLSSINYRDAWQSVLSGYFHHAVARNRDRQLTGAGGRHERSVMLVSYLKRSKRRSARCFLTGYLQLYTTWYGIDPPCYIPMMGLLRGIGVTVFTMVLTPLS